MTPPLWRDCGRGALFAHQAALLDGALADGDRATLIRLMSEAFGRPTETTVTVEKQEELPLEVLVDLWRAGCSRRRKLESPWHRRKTKPSIREG